LKSLSIDWRRGLVEFVIIVIGVLVALGVDRWNSTGEERALEREYLERLYRDVQADTASLGSILAGLEQKQESLLFLAELTAIAQRSVSDTAEFLAALSRSTSYGWIIRPLRTVTFEDLTTTGNLRLIRSAAVRAAAIEYYQNALHRANRVERRSTGYADLVYGLVPPGVLPQTGLSSGTDTGEVVDVARVVSVLGTADLRRQLTAERNYAAFARDRLEITRNRAIELLEVLRAYLDG